jgi:hypothetical protein
VAGEITPRNPVTIADNPAVTAAGGIQKTRWNEGMKLTGGSDKQLVERSTAADGTTGLNLTSTPSANFIIFPMNTNPADLPNGAMTITDDGTTVTIYFRRVTGSLVSMTMA